MLTHLQLQQHPNIKKQHCAAQATMGVKRPPPPERDDVTIYAALPLQYSLKLLAEISLEIHISRIRCKTNKNDGCAKIYKNDM
jgi:hypothetical protein